MSKKIRVIEGYPAHTLAAVALAALALGSLGGGYLQLSRPDKLWIDTSCLKEYPLTSRSVDCGNHEESAARMREIETDLTALAAEHTVLGHASRISIWIRDLETRRWVGVNESELYSPASMLKVPIMIAYFKLAEMDPAILAYPITYSQDKEIGDNIQNLGTRASLIPGQQYPTEKLIEAMIVDSDNDAMHSLLQHIGNQLILDTLKDFGIVPPQNPAQTDFVTPRGFANIFRALYNSSYLDREHSQKALALLSRSSYQPLRSNIPTSTVVASKFGERKLQRFDGSVIGVELHECGIVYANNPYSICIMTSGGNFDDLKQLINDISALAYKKLN